jgi:tRNA-2-methylthio-N6-dimethylallyladenosine synthase
MTILKSKKYYIKTFGCYANEVDSDVIAGVLEDLGFEELKKIKFKNETEEVDYVLKNADVFIVNSCSVRQKSEDKVYGLGKLVNEYEKKNKGSKKVSKKKTYVFLTGCVVGSTLGDRKRSSIEELKKKTRNYDFFFAPNDIYNFVNALNDLKLVNLKSIDKEFKKDLEKRVLKRRKSGDKHAFVNVSYGCDNFCSYCIVPYSRGGEISRSKKDILDEIKCLVKNGVKEITLCGQNVNSWGLTKREKIKVRSGSTQKIPFASLVRKVCEIKEIEKVDFMSSNPFDFTQDLVNVLKLPKISNYIHIAAQSGNNEILKAMNRRHTHKEFIDLVKRIKKIRPEIEIGTDLIVGFPGETRKQFMDTVKLVEEINFAVAFISMYSPRKGTYAQINLKDDVPMKQKKWRHMYITKVWKESKKSSRKRIGK